MIHKSDSWKRHNTTYRLWDFWTPPTSLPFLSLALFGRPAPLHYPVGRCTWWFHPTAKRSHWILILSLCRETFYNLAVFFVAYFFVSFDPFVQTSFFWGMFEDWFVSRARIGCVWNVSLNVSVTMLLFSKWNLGMCTWRFVTFEPRLLLFTCIQRLLLLPCMKLMMLGHIENCVPRKSWRKS